MTALFALLAFGVAFAALIWLSALLYVKWTGHLTDMANSGYVVRRRR